MSEPKIIRTKMDTLPDDMIVEIFRRLPQTSWDPLIRSSKSFYQIFENDIYPYLPELLSEKDFLTAVREGDIWTVQKALDEEKIFNWDRGLANAARGGWRVIVDQMLELGATHYNAALENAAGGGHQAIVDQMLRLGATDYNAALENAAEGGHQAIVDQMLALGATDYDGALAMAARGGHQRIVDQMLALGATNYNEALAYAARGGHQAIVNQMLAQGGHQRMLARGAMDYDDAHLYERDW